MVRKAQRVSLELLAGLEALVSERHAGRAAMRIGVSQSTLSEALTRLRAIYRDPLLVRRASSLHPTARALELVEPIREVLRLVRGTLAPRQVFEPGSAQLTFTISTVDYIQSVLLAPLVRQIAARAPSVTIAVLPLVLETIEDELKSGHTDLAIFSVRLAPINLRYRQLFTERFLCVARSGHAKLRRKPTLKQYLALDHLLVSQTGPAFNSIVEEALAAQGLKRRIQLYLPNYYVAAQIVAESDLVATMPERLARRVAQALPLALFEPPIELPLVSFSQMWHERSQNDPSHQWLRATLIDLCRGL